MTDIFSTLFFSRKKKEKVIPVQKLKSICGSEDIIDLVEDEIECLKRYHTMFRVMVRSGKFFPLAEPLTEHDIGKAIQGTILDWSVAHALQGEKLIDEIGLNMSYTVLQAALILTITIPLYINEPDFARDDDGFNGFNWARIFSAVIGFSAFCHILVLVGCTIQNMILNRPYSESDTLLARVETFGLFGIINVVNYIAVLAGLVGTLIAGFGRNAIDGYIQLYSIFICFYLFYLFIGAYAEGTIVQDKRIYAFYKKYCDPDGQLKDSYIEKIRKEINRVDDDGDNNDNKKNNEESNKKTVAEKIENDEGENEREEHKAKIHVIKGDVDGF